MPRTTKRPKVFQFTFFAAFGAGVPFMTVYYKHILVKGNGEVADYLIGALIFLYSSLGILATPISGVLSDRFNIRSKILGLFSFPVAVGGFLTALPGISRMNYLSLEMRFLFVLGGVILIGLFMRPLMPIIDSETLIVLHREYGEALLYGRIRVFGSIGWIVSTVITGYVLYRAQMLFISFLLFGGLFLVLGLLALGGAEATIEKKRIPWEHLRGDETFRTFMLFIFLNSLALTSAFNFTGYFMDDIGVNYFIIGASFGLSAVPELPIMYFSERILKKLGSKKMIISGSVIESVKLLIFILIALHGKNWLFFPVQLLHGVAYSMQYCGMVNFTDSLAHPDMRTTYQSIFHLTWSLGAALGGLWASFIIKNLGSIWLIGLDSAVLLLCIPIILFIKSKYLQA